MKYKIGDKVILLSKENSIDNLHKSKVYKQLQNKNQKFAYVVGCYMTFNLYVISADNHASAEYFYESDLKLYIKEERKLKLKKLNWL